VILFGVYIFQKRLLSVMYGLSMLARLLPIGVLCTVRVPVDTALVSAKHPAHQLWCYVSVLAHGGVTRYIALALLSM
jgi:hypothetical protein